MARYSSGKVARAICDRCGFAGPYRNMLTEAVTGLRVCRECQDGTDAYRVRRNIDPVYLLHHPRPDIVLVPSTTNGGGPGESGGGVPGGGGTGGGTGGGGTGGGGTGGGSTPSVYDGGSPSTTTFEDTLDGGTPAGTGSPLDGGGP